MPSRNRSEKACELASFSPNDTASADFSDIAYASRNSLRFLFLRQPLAKLSNIARLFRPVQPPDDKALDIVAARPRIVVRDDTNQGRIAKNTCRSPVLPPAT